LQIRHPGFDSQRRLSAASCLISQGNCGFFNWQGRGRRAEGKEPTPNRSPRPASLHRSGRGAGGEGGPTFLVGPRAFPPSQLPREADLWSASRHCVHPSTLLPLPSSLSRLFWLFWGAKKGTFFGCTPKKAPERAVTGGPEDRKRGLARLCVSSADPTLFWGAPQKSPPHAPRLRPRFE
jgi:hypothetical protein